MYGEKNLTENDGFNVGAVFTTAYNSTGTHHNYNNNLMALFGGWAGENCRLGLELNVQAEIENDGEWDLDVQNVQTLSFNYNINNQFDIFLRHDVINVTGLTNLESRSLFGFIWNPTKGLYLAPNVIISDAGDDSDAINEYRLTCMFKY